MIRSKIPNLLDKLTGKHRRINILLSEPITWDNNHRVVSRLPHRSQVRFALFCAKKVAHLIELKEAHDAIKVTERWLKRLATAKKCQAMAFIANTAARDTKRATNYISHTAAYAAIYTAHTVYYDIDEFSYASYAANKAIKATEESKQEQLKAEIMSYLKELVIEQLPQELKEDWLLIASL